MLNDDGFPIEEAEGVEVVAKGDFRELLIIVVKEGITELARCCGAVDWIRIDPEEKDWLEVVSEDSGSENAFSSCDSPSDSDASDSGSDSLSCDEHSDELFSWRIERELTDRFILCFVLFSGE